MQLFIQQKAEGNPLELGQKGQGNDKGPALLLELLIGNRPLGPHLGRKNTEDQRPFPTQACDTAEVCPGPLGPVLSCRCPGVQPLALPVSPAGDEHPQQPERGASTAPGRLLHLSAPWRPGVCFFHLSQLQPAGRLHQARRQLAHVPVLLPTYLQHHWLQCGPCGWLPVWPVWPK